MARFKTSHSPSGLSQGECNLLTRSRDSIIAAAILLLVVIGITRTNLVYKWQLLPILKSHQAIQAKELPLYKKDMSHLMAHFPFKSAVGGKANAGSFLNSRLFWLPRVSVARESKPNMIAVSDALRSELIRYGNDYLAHPSHFANNHLDFTFFATLSHYDYWDIETDSPISSLSAQNRFVPPNEVPIPDPLDLISVSRLRLMSADHESNVESALRDVRELARLMLTTENSQLVTAGLAILEDERSAYYFYVSRGKLKREDWAPISQTMLAETRRAFDGTEGYLHLWTQIATLEDLFLKNEPPVGFCSALNNQIPALMSLRAYLEPHLPFELDYRTEYRKFDEIIRAAKPHCRLRYLTELIRRDNFPARLPGIWLLNGWPYWRKLFALRASLADFSNFESYEKLSVVSHQVFDSGPADRIPADD